VQEIKSLALGKTVHHVEENHVSEPLEGTKVGHGSADISRPDKRYLFSSHHLYMF
jgi:hypothetical protein